MTEIRSLLHKRIVTSHSHSELNDVSHAYNVDGWQAGNVIWEMEVYACMEEMWSESTAFRN